MAGGAVLAGYPELGLGCVHFVNDLCITQCLTRLLANPCVKGGDATGGCLTESQSPGPRERRGVGVTTVL